jgi:two-component system, cell cycle sensor histidine kinase and response regulator CckA
MCERGRDVPRHRGQCMVDADMSRDELLSELEILRRRLEELASENTALRQHAHELEKQAGNLIANAANHQAMDREKNASDDTYRDMALSASEPMCITQDGFLKFANPAGSRLTGYSLQELQTMAFAQLAHPDDLEELTRIYLQRLRGESVTPGHRFRIITSGRETKWVESFSSTIRWEGRPAVLSMIRDVTKTVATEKGLRQAHEELEHRLRQRTADLQRINAQLRAEVQERRQAETALRETEERLRATVENTPHVAVQWFDEKGTVLFWNRASEKIFGWKADGAVGKTPDQLMHTREETAQFMKALMEIERTNQPLGPAEFHFTRKDGTDGYCLSTLFAIPSGGEGLCFVCMDVDITERKQARQELLQSEERMRLAWHTTPDALSITRLDDGTYIDVNEGFTFLTGYGRDEVIGKSALTLPFWDDPAQRQAFIAQLKQHGHARNVEITIRRKEGQTQAALASAGLMMLDGEPHLLSVTKNIEDLKRTETALRESEQKYRLLAENVSDVIWIADLDLRVSYVSPSVERLSGWAASEWSTLKPSDFLTPASLAVVNRVVADELSLQLHSTADCNRVKTVQLEQYRKDGTTIWTEVTARFLYDGMQKPIGIIGATRDISERRASEEQLNRLFAAVEHAGESILILDARGSILYANPAFLATSGYSVDEAMGSVPEILKSGGHERAVYEDIWSTIQSGKTWRGRFKNTKKDGSLYEETATISPIKDEVGRVINYVMVGRDVTSEVLLQKQLVQAQKMEAVGTLAGGIAHDFNNLLQAILGYSDLLLMNKGPGHPDRKRIEVIRHAARDGADLVTRILTFSRKGESRMRPIDLNQEVRRVEKLLRRTLQRMIQIDLALAEDLRTITADPAQIEQIILNLGVNAQHAMPDGGRLLIETDNVTVSGEFLRTQIGAKPGDYVLLSVSDNGVGIPPEILDRIFEPFFTTKLNGEGTGLGLAMVHGIVAQHGGYTRCYSEPGVGTSFQMYFPISESEFAADPALTREMPAFGSETILLVDDDDRVREMARQLLDMGGYKVLVARSGEEALDIYAARKDAISLVILDLIMPGMGGKLCLEELLRLDRDAKVLIASGYSSTRLGMDPRRHGARGFISKPYDAKALFGVVRQVLDHGHL